MRLACRLFRSCPPASSELPRARARARCWARVRLRPCWGREAVALKGTDLLSFKTTLLEGVGLQGLAALFLGSPSAASSPGEQEAFRLATRAMDCLHLVTPFPGVLTALRDRLGRASPHEWATFVSRVSADITAPAAAAVAVYRVAACLQWANWATAPQYSKSRRLQARYEADRQLTLRELFSAPRFCESVLREMYPPTPYSYAAIGLFHAYLERLRTQTAADATKVPQLEEATVREGFRRTVLALVYYLRRHSDPGCRHSLVSAHLPVSVLLVANTLRPPAPPFQVGLTHVLPLVMLNRKAAAVLLDTRIALSDLLCDPDTADADADAKRGGGSGGGDGDSVCLPMSVVLTALRDACGSPAAATAGAAVGDDVRVAEAAFTYIGATVNRISLFHVHHACQSELATHWFHRLRGPPTASLLPPPRFYEALRQLSAALLRREAPAAAITMQPKKLCGLLTDPWQGDTRRSASLRKWCDLIAPVVEASSSSSTPLPPPRAGVPRCRRR